MDGLNQRSLIGWPSQFDILCGSRPCAQLHFTLRPQFDSVLHVTFSARVRATFNLQHVVAAGGLPLAHPLRRHGIAGIVAGRANVILAFQLAQPDAVGQKFCLLLLCETSAMAYLIILMDLEQFLFS